MTTTVLTPTLRCQRLPKFDATDWDDVERAFADAEVCPMQQTWLHRIDHNFREANVATGWTDTHLVVFATLHDDDIFNPVKEFNGYFYTAGDVFEMFLRPEEQDTYFEFHVSPDNQHFQLKIPASDAFHKAGKQPGVLESWKIPKRTFESRVRVNVDENQWNVLAWIPFKVVMENGPVKPGTRWRFSFCRYDYSRKRVRPVLSSTSPHQRANFHRQQEWGTLTFE